MDGSRLLIRSDLICARPFTFCEMLVWPLDCQEQFVAVKNGLAHWKSWLHRKSTRPWQCAATVTRHIPPHPHFDISTMPLSTIWLTFSPLPHQSNWKPLSWCQDFLTPIFPSITGCHSAIFFNIHSQVQPTSTSFFPPQTHLPYLLRSSFSLNIAKCNNPRWKQTQKRKKKTGFSNTEKSAGPK